ncbi:unnamed protein product [Triticum turgidum subsp. durum]|uniref:Uncharacterized protein n=1 Tax=Triticum turgidum subsp. durum TaxID=4567 RepID=A0A9R1PUB8_TRITD|nr:unnamed protein product [Triticum turgidum subsp. durum]
MGCIVELAAMRGRKRAAGSPAAPAAASGARGRGTSTPEPSGGAHPSKQTLLIPPFWSSGVEQWPNIVPQEAAVSKVFGSRSMDKYGPRLTLLEATMRTDEDGSPFVKLVKHGSAALINAYTRTGFPFDSWEVKALLLEALVSEDAAAAQAERFQQANESCV